MRKNTIYISGPITDPQTGAPREGWREPFNIAAKKLRGFGFRVINPVELAAAIDATTPAPTNADYLMHDLQTICREARRLKAIYIIGTYDAVRQSAGITAEVGLAKTLGIPILLDYSGCSIFSEEMTTRDRLTNAIYMPAVEFVRDLPAVTPTAESARKVKT